MTRVGGLALLLFGWAVPASAQVKTVALAPVMLPRELRDGSVEAARQRFDSLLAAALTAAGFAVVPPLQSDAVWTRLRDSVGGFYDTYTGRIVPAKFEAIYVATRRELAARYGAEAWLHASIEIVSLPFGGGTAEWHGTSEPSGGRGGLGGLLLGRSVGRIPALSLVVAVEDTGGTTLYQRAGGIQLLGKIAGGDLHRVPAESLFADTARTRGAVRLALDSLPAVLRRPRPPS